MSFYFRVSCNSAKTSVRLNKQRYLFIRVYNNIYASVVIACEHILVKIGIYLTSSWQVNKRVHIRRLE